MWVPFDLLLCLLEPNWLSSWTHRVFWVFYCFRPSNCSSQFFRPSPSQGIVFSTAFIAFCALSIFIACPLGVCFAFLCSSPPGLLPSCPFFFQPPLPSIPLYLVGTCSPLVLRDYGLGSLVLWVSRILDELLCVCWLFHGLALFIKKIKKTTIWFLMGCESPL